MSNNINDLSKNSSSSGKHSLLVFLIVICSGMGGILYGYDIGVISGALLFIKQTIPMTTQQTEIVVGAVLGGGLIGTIITGYCADRFGRRTMIIVACLVFIVGIFEILLSHDFLSLLGARLLLGLGVGMVTVGVPLYLAEVAPKNIRGRSVTIFQLFLTMGILLAYLVDLAFTPTGNWHGMFAVLFIPTLILLISMIILPETPRWLITHGHLEKARMILNKIRHPIEAEYEFNENIENKELTHGKWNDLFSKKLMVPLAIAISIAILNQLTGINSFLQYAPLIIHDTGNHTNVGVMLGTVSMGTINFIFTIIGLFLVDVVGRKNLLMWGTLGIIASQVFLALLPHFTVAGIIQSYLNIGGLLVYIAAFAIGPGIVVWLAVAELFPTRVRGKGMALCLGINSLASAVLATVFLNIIHTFTIHGAFWLFAIFTAFYFLIAKYLLPETKGKSLEQVESELVKDAPGVSLVAE